MEKPKQMQPERALYMDYMRQRTSGIQMGKPVLYFLRGSWYPLPQRIKMVMLHS